MAAFTPFISAFFLERRRSLNANLLIETIPSSPCYLFICRRVSSSSARARRVGSLSSGCKLAAKVVLAGILVDETQFIKLSSHCFRTKAGVVKHDDNLGILTYRNVLFSFDSDETDSIFLSNPEESSTWLWHSIVSNHVTSARKESHADAIDDCNL